MQLNKYLFFTTVLILTVLICVFAHLRNNKRLVEKVAIHFEPQEARFLSAAFVDKLLIQNKGALPWKPKDSLVLIMLETLIEENPYVQNAEVFHFQQGVLGVNIQEKNAVVRVQGSEQYYLDKAGNQLPISKNHTPKVPVFLGALEEEQKDDLLSLIDQIDKDSFLQGELASIHYRSNSYFIGLRSYGFEVEIGQMRHLSQKLSKLKVFCAYHDNYNLEKNYTLINLKFKNQVVGS